MITDISTLKEHLHVDFDDDDAEITRLLDGAQDHIEGLLGYRIEERFPNDKPENKVPPALIVAVCQLAAYWYEHREVAVTGTISTQMPMMVNDIIREYRDWSW